LPQKWESAVNDSIKPSLKTTMWNLPRSKTHYALVTANEYKYTHHVPEQAGKGYHKMLL
jgi:hypothetical protein